MSRLKLNIHRIKVVFGTLQRLKAWMPYVQSWQDPMHSTLVIMGISSAAFYPNVVIPLALLYLVVRTARPFFFSPLNLIGVCVVHARGRAHGTPRNDRRPPRDGRS